MSETNGYIAKHDLRDSLDDAFRRFSQHIVHRVGLRFDGVNTRLESIDARLKFQVDLIQSALDRTLDGAGLK